MNINIKNDLRNISKKNSQKYLGYKMSFSPYNSQKLKYRRKPIYFSDHAKGELIIANLSVYELVDMLNNPVPCPKGRRIKEI